jgi:TolA-binding protein
VASRKDVTEATDRAMDSEESSYAQAHQAHFVDRDWTAALRAWDYYLQAYPSGRLVVEARYNRALALVRLGRMTEARNALAPFADAPVGSYRQREARTLVNAIEAHLSSERW